MKSLIMMMSLFATGIFVISCAMTPDFNSKIQQERQAGSGNCIRTINDVYKSYCAKKPKSVPTGYSDNVERTRNSISLNCKDSASQQELKKIDTCIDELRSRER